MIGGAIYGTGRKFAVLTAHERVTAMKVCSIPTDILICSLSKLQD
jgi:hypothetical protein